MRRAAVDGVGQGRAGHVTANEGNAHGPVLGGAGGHIATGGRVGLHRGLNQDLLVAARGDRGRRRAVSQIGPREIAEYVRRRRADVDGRACPRRGHHAQANLIARADGQAGCDRSLDRIEAVGDGNRLTGARPLELPISQGVQHAQLVGRRRIGGAVAPGDDRAIERGGEGRARLAALKDRAWRAGCRTSRCSGWSGRCRSSWWRRSQACPATAPRSPTPSQSLRGGEPGDQPPPAGFRVGLMSLGLACRRATVKAKAWPVKGAGARLTPGGPRAFVSRDGLGAVRSVLVARPWLFLRRPGQGMT